MLDKKWVKELDIQSPNLIGYLKRCFSIIPSEFRKAKASTSGKYHPFFSRAEGGLLHGHTRYAIFFVNHLCEYLEFTQYEKEQAIIAMLLHDSFKGFTKNGKWGHSQKNHAFVAYEKFSQIPINDFKMMDGTVLNGQEAKTNILKAIRYHMGQWSSPNIEKISAIEERWVNKYVFIVQVADYLSSRQDIPKFILSLNDLYQEILKSEEKKIHRESTEKGFILMSKVVNFPSPILTLDPSLNCTGYSVFIGGELKDKGFIFFRAEPLKGCHKESTGEKLYIIEMKVKEIIDRWNIKLVVMERYMQLFNQKNGNNTSSQTAQLLPMVRGVLVKSFFEKGIEFISISDTTVKKVTTGNHKAKKKQIMNIVNELYDLELKTKNDENISDAIAVGFTFLKIYDFKIQLHDIESYVEDAIDFFNKYNGTKNKTQKALRLIGVDISKWKRIYGK